MLTSPVSPDLSSDTVQCTRQSGFEPEIHLREVTAVYAAPTGDRATTEIACHRHPTCALMRYIARPDRDRTWCFHLPGVSALVPLCVRWDSNPGSMLLKRSISDLHNPNEGEIRRPEHIMCDRPLHYGRCKYPPTIGRGGSSRS